MSVSAVAESSPASIREDMLGTGAVLVAPARASRPQHGAKQAPAACPFCPGNEARTPAALATLGGDAAWQARLIPNLYPIVCADAVPAAVGKAAVGFHEIIIDHREHGIRLSQMSVDHVAAILRLVRDRMRALYAADKRIRSVMFFKNAGRAAGASIAHSHAQLVALPVMAPELRRRLEAAKAYYERHDRCGHCAEISEGGCAETNGLLIERDAQVTVTKPHASRWPWELRLHPCAHGADYCEADDALLAALAGALVRSLRRVEAVAGECDYNLCLHSLRETHVGLDARNAFHWHLEILPRTTVRMGFELASGLALNSVPPELAAAHLRDAPL